PRAVGSVVLMSPRNATVLRKELLGITYGERRMVDRAQSDAFCPPSDPYPGIGRLAGAAVAVLVFLARTARTILVAADLAPGRGVLRIARGRSDHRGGGRQRDVGERHLVLAGVGV